MNEAEDPWVATSRLVRLAGAYESTLERIGEEIHDGPIQYLAGAKMWIDSLLRPGLDPHIAEALTHASTALAEGVQVTRRCMNALRLDLPQPCELIPGILSVLQQFKVMPDRTTIRGEILADDAWDEALTPIVCRALSAILQSYGRVGRSLLGAQLEFDSTTLKLRLALGAPTGGSKAAALTPAAAGDEVLPIANQVASSDLWRWLGGTVEVLPDVSGEVQWIMHLRIRGKEIGT